MNSTFTPVSSRRYERIESIKLFVLIGSCLFGALMSLFLVFGILRSERNYVLGGIISFALWAAVELGAIGLSNDKRFARSMKTTAWSLILGAATAFIIHFGFA